MNPGTKLSIPAEVMARQVGVETVILHLVTGTYFGLNDVGTRVWEMLGQGQSLPSICGVLLGEFDIDRKILEQDVEALVMELVSNGLVVATE